MADGTTLDYDSMISCPSCGGNKNYELSPATDDNENERWFMCLKKGELCPQFSIVNKG